MAIASSEQFQSDLVQVSKLATDVHYPLVQVNQLIYTSVLFSTTKGGNILRGRTVLDSGWMLNGQNLSRVQNEDLKVLGCLVELLNAAYLIWDDIMDGSSTWRGQPCWYRREAVGMMAINDACLVKSAIYVTLKERFHEHEAYIDLYELFAEASLRTELGQHCDLMSSARLVELDRFCWDHCEFITMHKTAFYTFYLPVAIPLVYLRIATSAKLKQVYEVSMLLGLVFQARDDFLDVYGDEKVTGKIGTDIQEHKCSWLSVMALQHCNDEEKSVLRNCYGSTNRDNVAKVKDIFQELNLAKIFYDLPLKEIFIEFQSK
ncbi:terpenoid synthase [Aspergillus pseudonomiae]|uniref:Terpenoid synthase n=1 Tax=Aspergillus pseudonomiae TaxID=1506151 RepID=A0A5N7DD88_9EURO|nr:terpenoid synthase [Aspergillus pseudonomiae]KAE8404361.1 terpenoid synthase [Aspergillus pseudonomiae]